MNIQFLHSWLKEHLETTAPPQKIAECLSLSGPSFERVKKVKSDYLYDIEVTTNRVDSMAVRGIAREAAAILPRFGIKAKLKPLSFGKTILPPKSLPFKVVDRDNLLKRATAIILTDIENWDTPEWLKRRLETAGMRSLNAVVDITNYVMLELGMPSHAFDYDKIVNKKFVVRESEKGEEVTTFDGKKYKLPGGDVIFDNGEGEIIDVPGIIGTKNSVVTKGKTKRVLLFIDICSPQKIRKTSMSLGIRTYAATINEKAPDPEMTKDVISYEVTLLKKMCKAKVASKIYDTYKSPYKKRVVTLTEKFISDRLGVEIGKKEILKILRTLGFGANFSGTKLEVTVPSFRSADIYIPEDILEEIARIYGYYRLPSNMLSGEIPVSNQKLTLGIEKELKEILRGVGGVEIYTLPLVPEEYIVGNKEVSALQIKNPLGSDTSYLRNTLRPSLTKAAKENLGKKDQFHLFEIANVYLPKSGKLPDEVNTLSGIFSGFNYREAKGVVEALLSEFNIDFTEKPDEMIGFVPSKRIVYTKGGKVAGQFGMLDENSLIYYEFRVKDLEKYKRQRVFKLPPKYPPQVEDLTFEFLPKTKVGEVLNSIKATSTKISKISLIDIFENSYTFRVWYQNPKKTLTNKEVEKLRKGIIKKVSERFGATVKG